MRNNVPMQTGGSMDFTIRLQELAERVRQAKELVQTEEATKNALVLPFLQTLGYDVFNPAEVVPEYTADVGTKNREKVDFAIIRDGQIVMLLECKQCGSTLDSGKSGQLLRYFNVTPSARIGILTDGVRYQFFTDADNTPNIMDTQPFMEFDITNPDESLVPELKKLTKSKWDADAVMSAAAELKYTRSLKAYLAGELLNPSEEFVRLCAKRMYPGFFTAKIQEVFAGRVKRAFQLLISEQINERLKSAMVVHQSEAAQEPSEQKDAAVAAGPSIVTTVEELEGFHAVKAILRCDVDPRRIVMRDTLSYCGVLLDDNNRKPICRLHFNGKQKYLGLFDADKREERIPIAAIDDIYAHADRLKETVGHYNAAETKTA
jgi:hypothetical protein